MKKRMVRLALGVWLGLAAGAAGYVLLKTAYQGNDRVVLLNSGQAYTSLQDIIKQPVFRNKIIYVDVWGTTCPPCFLELKDHTPKLTQRYRQNENIAFLYLCIDRHPLPEVRWKSKIQELQPAGYHALVEATEEAKLANDILGKSWQSKYVPYEPFYFIVDRRGKIVGQPIANPDQGELRPSDGPRLYAKLDSLLRS